MVVVVLVHDGVGRRGGHVATPRGRRGSRVGHGGWRRVAALCVFVRRLVLLVLVLVVVVVVRVIGAAGRVWRGGLLPEWGPVVCRAEIERGDPDVAPATTLAASLP